MNTHARALRDALARITADDPNHQSGIKKRLVNLIRNWDMAHNTGKFYIGVYGTPKMGKSTLLNSLVGENILPNCPIPMTGTVIDLIRDGQAMRYSVSSYRRGDCDVKQFDTPEGARHYLNAIAGQKNPCDKVDIIGPFPQATSIFRNQCVLRDTPGAEASVEEGEVRLTEDTTKAMEALKETHLPLFCCRADMMGAKNDYALYQAFIVEPQRECIHVITHCDEEDAAEDEKAIQDFYQKFKIVPSNDNPQVTVCTGIRDRGRGKLVEAMEQFLDHEKLYQRLVSLAQSICDQPEKLGSTVSQVNWDNLQSALKP